MSVPAVAVVFVPPALGVKPVAPAGVWVVFQPPVQLPIGRLLPPSTRLVGRVKESVKPSFAALTTSNRPAPASAIATVLLTPGVTLPNWRLFPAVTVTADSTVAVAWMLALVCASAAVAPTLKPAARTADSTVAVRMCFSPLSFEEVVGPASR
jgi:hypothetical protein